ncbi:MAG: helix-turn-helix domain-containing protein [Desulfobacteraceae bacterium]|nr:MAG: helix-turn-helix domain-containing protein [Desulfobacteraceae bacterium]
MRREGPSEILAKNLFSRILDSYRELIQFEAHLFPIEDEEGIRSIEGHYHPFCYTIRTSSQGRMSCLKDINRAIQISMKTGEPYIFQCHAGVIGFTATLRDSKNNAAAFVCGPILLRQPDAYAEQHILSRIKDLSPDKAALRKFLKNIPVCSERRVQAAADLLFLISSYFSKIDILTRHQQLEISRQQSLLAEEIFLSKALQTDGNKPIASPTNRRGNFYQENELINMIKIGNRKKAKALLDEILGSSLFRSHEHIGILKARALEIVFVITRAAVEAGANLEEIFGFKYQCVQNLSKDDSQESLYYFLMKAFDQLFECIYQNRNIRHTTVFMKAKEYIWKNYNQEISLKDLADAVGMNPYYLSHLFTKEMGISFREYLASVRISIAKSLLQQTNMSMMDICLEVGYQDPSHFAKIFKKNEGVQPSGYRKRGCPK